MHSLHLGEVGEQDRRHSWRRGLVDLQGDQRGEQRQQGCGRGEIVEVVELEQRLHDRIGAPERLPAHRAAVVIVLALDSRAGGFSRSADARSRRASARRDVRCVRDDDADPAEPPEGAHEERPAFRVEMVRWLVEQEDVRLHGERGADLPALALARRERRPAFEGSAVGASRLLKRASVERRCVSCFGMTSCPERPALRGLAGIVDLPVRIGAVARHVRTSPDAFVAQLERLIVESGLGSNAAAEAVVACALWLLDQDDARVSELGTLAVRDGHGLVSALLAEAAPHRGLARGGRLARRSPFFAHTSI